MPSTIPLVTAEISLSLTPVFRFQRARTPQNVAERVVAFMTGVFINRLGGRRPDVFARPGPVPGIGIVDRESIEKRSVVHPRETLHDVEVFGGPAESGFVGEVGGVHD